ncbi:hypothetical protein DUNSADRAFT_15091 [Dunaliella salina]|uniref:Uncharacterized protein n=1 Tax=Dunaliella salina TaxID=3046 RepID=A0ABQ7G616_DUNSA|nr:hypothetical protein DUNSADRAFT_15091 [Dunaliella salina]|eukprot:KAF5830050.1 hypothetical protein DUNSADRAFT_15091 [Dunaliella salina]
MQASRKKWRILQEHCCKTGGDAEVEKTGQSARYFIETSFQEHERALAAAGALSFADWHDFQEGIEEPLFDREQPFRSSEPWERFASQVFDQAPFQWYNEV